MELSFSEKLMRKLNSSQSLSSIRLIFNLIRQLVTCITNFGTITQNPSEFKVSAYNLSLYHLFVQWDYWLNLKSMHCRNSYSIGRKLDWIIKFNHCDFLFWVFSVSFLIQFRLDFSRNVFLWKNHTWSNQHSHDWSRQYICRIMDTNI